MTQHPLKNLETISFAHRAEDGELVTITLQFKGGNSETFTAAEWRGMDGENEFKVRRSKEVETWFRHKRLMGALDESGPCHVPTSEDPEENPVDFQPEDPGKQIPL